MVKLFLCCMPPFSQVTGRRRVLLISPSQAFRGGYPFPVHHPYDTYCMPDLEAPNPGMWPEVAGLHGRVAILQPGEVLYIPAYWCAAGMEPHVLRGGRLRPVHGMDWSFPNHPHLDPFMPGLS
jgi:hypothetical protein